MARTSMYGDSPEDLRKVNLKTVRLGPTPMTTSVKFYTAWMAPNLSPTTLEVDARKLRYFAKFFEDLASRGVISSADPRRFEKSAIMEFMIWMKGKGLNPSTQDKYLQILGRWLKLFGNKVLEKMHKDATIKFPQADRERPIEALTREELQRVFDAAEGIPGEPGVRIRGFIAIAFTIGGRPKEVIRSHIEDINLEKRTFFVRHPKGEGTWGRSEEVPMLRRDTLCSPRKLKAK